MKYCILNFVHGNGPYLRTTELALAVNEILEKRGHDRFGIIVPWVYGEKQKKIMQEEFSDVINKYKDEIILEEKLGEYIRELFFSGAQTYSESLEYFSRKYEEVQNKINKHLDGGVCGETFAGEKVFIAKKDISFGISRAPRLALDIKPCYYTGFAYMSDILRNAAQESDKIGIDESLLMKCVPLFESVERAHDLHFIAEPGTFSYDRTFSPGRETEISTPPSMALPSFISHGDIETGLYITVSGIPGLEDLYHNLYQDVSKFGCTIYTNSDSLSIKSKKIHPNVLTSDKMMFHVARSGWGSVWLSLFTKTPLITPRFVLKDDPEIYFNNICLEKIGLGIVYSSHSMEELNDFASKFKLNANKTFEQLLEKYGTLEGVKYTAEKIVDHFLAFKE